MKHRPIALLLISFVACVASLEAGAVDWLEVAQSASVRQGDAGPVARRARSLVQESIRAALGGSDAGHGNGGTGNAGHGNGGTAQLEAAAEAVAAYVALEHLYPDQQPEFERLLALVLSEVPETDAKAAALARARQAATAVMAADAK